MKNRNMNETDRILNFRLDDVTMNTQEAWRTVSGV